MSVEIEMTCLVVRMPDLPAHVPYDDIRQGYFSSGSDALRIRQRGATHELTRKTIVDPGDFSTFHEQTIAIKPEEFDRLWPTVLKHLEKRRFAIALPDGLTCELDIFQGDLTGLILAEVEFPNREARDQFTAPGWFGPDVTQEHWPAGEFLAGRTYADIAALLPH